MNQYCELSMSYIICTSILIHFGLDSRYDETRGLEERVKEHCEMEGLASVFMLDLCLFPWNTCPSCRL